MKTSFRATSPQDYEQIKVLLCSAFRCGPNEPFLERSHMEWKYWDPRPGWLGSRSYVLERGGSLVAHGCAWPLLFEGSGGSIRVLHLVDWAADPKALGSGSVLLDKMRTLADGIVSVGGSDTTKRILPKLGFAPVGEFRTFARPLRPFRQAISHQSRGWRLPIRFARNLVWSLSGGQIPPGWQARAVSPEKIESWPRSHGGELCPSRGADFYEYVLRCPTAECRFFSVRKEDRGAGYFCLSLVPGQARIVELWMESDDPAVWGIGYALASRESAAMGAAEVVGAASSQTGWNALAVAGYRLRSNVPIMAQAQTSADFPRLLMQMADGDAFFLHHGKPQYMT